MPYCKTIGCSHNVFNHKKHCAECEDMIELHPLLTTPISPKQPPLLGVIPKPIKPTPDTDAVVEMNRAMLLHRSQVGLRKYGTALATAGYSEEQLLQHAIEEALDLANYLQTRLMQIRGQLPAAA